MWAKSRLADGGWRLLIAGSGSLETPLRELAKALGVEDCVSFLGHVADTDSLLRDAAVLLAPAPAEPFGLSVAEAMAFGVPVVAARGGAHPETLGPDGRYFEPGTPSRQPCCLLSSAVIESCASPSGNG